MNRISKSKRTQLILVVLAALVAVGGLWYTLIRYQHDKLGKLEGQRKIAKDKLSQIQDTIRNSAQIEAELLTVSNKLAAFEEAMPSGDLYSSMVNTIRRFKTPYDIEIPQLTSAGSPVDVNLLPKFPYKQVSLSISGTGFYFGLGRFLADFENQFPYSRVLNLELVPGSASRLDEREKLGFRVEIVSLVRPGGLPPTNTR